MIIRRGKGKYTNCITIKNFYKHYLEQNPKDSDTYCTQKEFLDIAKTYLKNLALFVVDDAGVVTLPYRLGVIAVRKYKSNLRKVPIDWKATKEEGCIVYNFNYHSNGYRYRVHWNKKRCRVKNKMYYSFQLTRQNNRRIAENIKSKKIDYFYFMK
jgi:hypothetical protein